MQEIRARHFAQYHLCVRCEKKGRVTLACELDHIIALDNGGSDTTDNRQGLCIPCHKEKTAEDMGFRYVERVKIGVDGWPVGSP